MKRLICMALGKRKPKQDELFIPTVKLATGPGHPFYAKLNEVLAEAGFDAFVEKLCFFVAAFARGQSGCRAAFSPHGAKV